MRKYVNPEIELIVLQSADCITLSEGSVSSDPDTDKDVVNFSTFWGA